MEEGGKKERNRDTGSWWAETAVTVIKIKSLLSLSNYRNLFSEGPEDEINKL
jgi:hypothetical protein